MQPLVKWVPLLGPSLRPRYLLYDNFDVPLAAGSVNNSLSTSPYPTGGGVLRTTIDTNLKMSVSGNALVCITGGVAAGDPATWWGRIALPRMAGMMFLGLINSNSGAGQGVRFGWDSNLSGAATDRFGFNASGALVVSDAVLSNIAVGAFVDGTDYTCLLLVRQAGMFYFIKGGAFTTFRLLYFTTASTGAIFPTVNGANVTVCTAKIVRVPYTLWLPTPLAYDTFVRANGALGSTETVSPDNLSVPALTWNFTTGIWAIASNLAVATPGTGADVIVNGTFATDTNWTKGANWTIAAGVATAAAATTNLDAAVAPLTLGTWYKVTYTITAFTGGTLRALLGGVGLVAQASAATFTETNRAGSTAFAMDGVAAFTGSIDNVIAVPLTLADLFASVTVSTQDVLVSVPVTSVAAVSTQSGVVVNLDSTTTPANFVLGYIDRGLALAKLVKCVAGVYTEVVSASITYAAGAVVQVIKDGTSYRLFYNNALVGAVSTISDAGIISNLNHGVFSTDSRNSLGIFQCWPRGVNNEFAVLDEF